MARNVNPEVWRLSVEVWKSGAVVTQFMEQEIAGLRGTDGEPLPEIARQFLLDLIYCRIKPRRGRAISKSMVRDMYQQQLFFEQVINESGAPKSTPTERAITTVAKLFKMSEGSVSLIIHPRKARRT